MSDLRPVQIMNVAIYDGMRGRFHGFHERTVSTKKTGNIIEVVGLVELEDGRILQLSTNRFKFLDSEKGGSYGG